MNSTQVFEKRKIAVTIGIDLAKDHCDVVAYNADNKICFTKANMAYPQPMEWLANREPAVVLMEACKGSMVHARNIADLGHDTRLVKGLMSRHCEMSPRRTTYAMRTTLPDSTMSPRLREESTPAVDNEWKETALLAFAQFTHAATVLRLSP